MFAIRQKTGNLGILAPRDQNFHFGEKITEAAAFLLSFRLLFPSL